MEFKKLNFKKPSSIIKIAIIIVILGLICLIIAFLPFGYFSRNVTNNINSTLIGFGTGLILTAITISFIQYFLDQQKFKIKEEIERKQERDNLIKLDRIMEILIVKYILCFNSITRPKLQLDDNNRSKLDLNFKVEELYKFFNSSICNLNDDFLFFVEYFYKSESRLREFIIDVVGKNDFEYNEKILEIFSQFIKISLYYEANSLFFSDYASKSFKLKINNLIKNNKTEELKKIELNIHNQLWLFNKLLKEEGRLILEYQNEIEKIKKSQEV